MVHAHRAKASVLTLRSAAVARLTNHGRAVPTPGHAGGIQQTHSGGIDAIVTKLNATGTTLFIRPPGAASILIVALLLPETRG